MPGAIELARVHVYNGAICANREDVCMCINNQVATTDFLRLLEDCISLSVNQLISIRR